MSLLGADRKLVVRLILDHRSKVKGKIFLYVTNNHVMKTYGVWKYSSTHS